MSTHILNVAFLNLVTLLPMFDFVYVIFHDCCRWNKYYEPEKNKRKYNNIKLEQKCLTI